MTPTRYDLSLWQGNTTKWQFTLSQSPGVPFPLTGAEIVVWIRWSGGAFRLSNLNGNTGIPVGDTSSVAITDATNGVVLVVLTPAASRMITDPTAKWELEYRLNGDEETPLYGIVNISAWGLNDDN